MAKGTILEGPGAPGTGTGGGFLPAPQIRPGVVEKLLAPPLAVADLFGQALATSNTVRYVVEGTATSAATGVAEAATSRSQRSRSRPSMSRCARSRRVSSSRTRFSTMQPRPQGSSTAS
jgi:hypothetical protein